MVFLHRSAETAHHCIYIYTYIHTHRAQNGGRRDEKEMCTHTHTAREERRNATTWIQAPRRWRHMRLYLSHRYSWGERDGRKTVQRKSTENSRQSTRRNGDAFTKNLNCKSWGISYLFLLFLYTCLTACPCPLLSKSCCKSRFLS